MHTSFSALRMTRCTSIDYRNRKYHLAQFAKLYCDCATAHSAKMKLIGFLLLLSGWVIVIAALAMLHGAAVSVFILAGITVEILGFVLAARAHLPVGEER